MCCRFPSLALALVMSGLLLAPLSAVAESGAALPTSAAPVVVVLVTGGDASACPDAAERLHQQAAKHQDAEFGTVNGLDVHIPAGDLPALFVLAPGLDDQASYHEANFEACYGDLDAFIDSRIKAAAQIGIAVANYNRLNDQSTLLTASLNKLHRHAKKNLRLRRIIRTRLEALRKSMSLQQKSIVEQIDRETETSAWHFVGRELSHFR